MGSIVEARVCLKPLGGICFFGWRLHYWDDLRIFLCTWLDSIVTGACISSKTYNIWDEGTPGGMLTWMCGICQFLIVFRGFRGFRRYLMIVIACFLGWHAICISASWPLRSYSYWYANASMVDWNVLHPHNDRMILRDSHVFRVTGDCTATATVDHLLSFPNDQRTCFLQHVSPPSLPTAYSLPKASLVVVK